MPGLILHAANSAATLGIPESRLDLVRCGIAAYGMDPFGVDSRRPRAGAGARAALLPRGGQADRAGPERGLRPPLRGRGADLDRHGAGRLRRRRPAGAHQRRRPARRRAPGPARRHGLDGQRHRRPRAGRAAAGRRGGRPARAARAASGCSRRSGRAGSARSPTRSRARSAAACRGSTTGEGAARRRPRRPSPGEDGVDRRRRGARPPARPRDRRPRPRRARRPAAPPRGRWREQTRRRRLPALGRVRRLARRRPGRRLARRPRHRCATATSAPTSPRATSRSTRWPSRSPAASCSIPHGGRADLEARRLRMVSAGALAADPLRALRAVRIAVLLGLTIEPATAAAIGRTRRGSARVAPERVFGELKQVVCAPAVRQGLALMEAHGITAQVLPELLAAARRRPERLPPPRRARPHARGARPGRRARARPGRGRLRRARRRGRRAAGRAARRRPHPRRGHALRRAAARRREAADAGAAAGWPRRSAFPATTARARRSRAPSCGACGPRRSSSTTSPRCACTTCGSASSSTSGRSAGARCRATCARRRRERRGHALHGRRPARDARPQRRARRSRRTSSSRASCSARRSRAAARAARRRSSAATSWPASSGSRPGRRSATLLAQLDEDRYAGEIAHARGRDQAGAGAGRPLRLSDRTAAAQTSTHAATVPKSRFAATSSASGSWRPSCTGRSRRAPRSASPALSAISASVAKPERRPPPQRVPGALARGRQPVPGRRRVVAHAQHALALEHDRLGPADALEHDDARPLAGSAPRGGARRSRACPP